MTARRALPDRAALAFWALLIGAVWLRVLALQHNVLNLHFDEAQYWAWSRSFEWGYFSKPPLIAWVIAATTSFFGDSEWAVRLAAPFAHGLAALALYALGRRMYGPWPGFWAGFGWLMLPSVWLSSGIVSTDALLLPLWAIALFATWKLTLQRSWFWAVALGLAIGFGALAKYAMLYFPLCALVASWWHKPTRQALFNLRGALAGAVALALLAPNLVWNAQHSFATITHTASNAAIFGFELHPGELGAFLLDQAGVVGPILFILFVGLLIRALRRASGLSDEDRFLLAFILPPLLVVSVIALISRANANWAVSAFPAAIVWISGSVFAWRRGARWLAAAAAFNLAIGATLTAVSINPDLGDRIGLANSVKRVRAWDDTAHEIATRAMAQPGDAPFTAVLVDDRATYFELTYYWRNARRAGAPLPPVRMWLLHGHPLNSAEQTDPMRPAEGARVLVVHARPAYLPLVAGDFTGFRTVEHISIPLGGGQTRNFEISVGELFAPAPRDEAFEARIPD
jgi:4-amino-4-deoxy-L-arabinose transferase-like glycosyltransferase